MRRHRTSFRQSPFSAEDMQKIKLYISSLSSTSFKVNVLSAIDGVVIGTIFDIWMDTINRNNENKLTHEQTTELFLRTSISTTIGLVACISFTKFSKANLKLKLDKTNGALVSILDSKFQTRRARSTDEKFAQLSCKTTSKQFISLTSFCWITAVYSGLFSGPEFIDNPIFLFTMIILGSASIMTHAGLDMKLKTEIKNLENSIIDNSERALLLA